MRIYKKKVHIELGSVFLVHFSIYKMVILINKKKVSEQKLFFSYYKYINYYNRNDQNKI